jgi:hypothetical protein
MKLNHSFKNWFESLISQKRIKWLKYDSRKGIGYSYHVGIHALSWGFRVVIAIIFAALIAFSTITLKPGSFNNWGNKIGLGPMKLKTNLSEQQTVSSSSKTPSATLSVNTPTFTHSNIITTEFWVGEPSDASNGYIANAQSAWDGSWQSHYGGIDNPNNRSGYFPASFKPKENPFYFALPYNDINEAGKRKSNAKFCPNSTISSLANYSWCKNAWIKIRYQGKVAYAQWEDVGPFEEDDSSYVFGNAMPKNKEGEKAGLDVSPAVSTLLGLHGKDNCDWSFVDFNNVPNGPWRQIITSSKGYSI